MIATTRTPSSTLLPRTAVALLICGLVTAGASAARAGNSQADVPQVQVSYSDLDLTRQQDAVILYRRISVAARDVCPPEGGLSARVAAMAHRCVTDAIARAVDQVNSPQLAQVRAAYSRRLKLG